MDESQLQSVHHLLFHCGSLREKDRALILFDEITAPIAEAFIFSGQGSCAHIEGLRVDGLINHGQEPPPDAREKMLHSDLVISLCTFSLAHSQARIESNNNGGRFLSLPLFTQEMLKDPAVRVDFKKQAPIVREFADEFSKGSQVRITSPSGTDITLDITGRQGNYCPGFVQTAGDLGSPPDIEANVSPVETASEGVVVIDGSITCPEIGVVTNPVTLEVTNGKISRFSCDSARVVSFLEKTFEDPGSLRRVLAECGVGLNPEAKLTGNMLTDEGALGCVHFGFGSNHTVGGKNKVDFHLDFVFKNPTLFIDDREMIKNGNLTL